VNRRDGVQLPCLSEPADEAGVFRHVVGGDSHENTDLGENLARVSVNDDRPARGNPRVSARATIGLNDEPSHSPDSAVRIMMALL
jgi:hypothetical protein